MDTFIVIGIVALGAIFIGFVGHCWVTNSIIKDQQREIAKLRTENKRLKGRNTRPAKPDFGKW
jgi:hypothetical protein